MLTGNFFFFFFLTGNFIQLYNLPVAAMQEAVLCLVRYCHLLAKYILPPPFSFY